MPMHAGADVGDRKAARGALQQAHAKIRFELADTAAQPRLGDPERTLGRGASRRRSTTIAK
ncbi:hypothetical protein XPU_3364 [Xanthomonas arboricola pv. pruni str. MAFF 311562]|uniref:Uncharacterized protein n=1 Tax=Xanthomonas arboricola pv. pruni str. MAFF 311562 TaxID=1414836 RepID=W4S633_9XANT|nr:hypothetical protein XPU_3364 [Xanthomonas arboricola pv. pruni str. MAFF 311562]